VFTFSLSGNGGFPSPFAFAFDLPYFVNSAAAAFLAWRELLELIIMCNIIVTFLHK